jgi:hypothetical protein
MNPGQHLGREALTAAAVLAIWSVVLLVLLGEKDIKCIVISSHWLEVQARAHCGGFVDGMMQQRGST